MHPTLSAFTTLAAALALSGGAARSADLELLTNGGFEDGLAGWTRFANSGQTRAEPDAKEKSEGRQSLRLERTGGTGWDFLKQFVDLPPGHDTLELRLDYKVAKGARLEAVFYFADAQGNPAGKGSIPVLNEGRTRRFERLEERLAIPPEARRCGIDLILKQPGTVWIDAVSVAIPGAGPPELGPLELANPGFEDGLDWWTPLPHESGRTEARADTRVKAAGRAALCLERDSPRLWPEDGLCAAVPELGRARRVRLRLQARADGDARPVVVLQAFDARGVALETARLELPPGGARFAPHELLLSVPKEAARLELSLRVRGAGRAWFDDLELKKG